MAALRRLIAPILALLLTFWSVAEVSAPVTVAAGVVLGVGHAQAATPAPKAVVLNGVPGWVLRASGALPSIDMDFAHNRAWVGGSGPRAPPSLLTTTRASTGYAQWADGHLSLFAANVPRITDLGLLVEEARTNVVLWNRDLTNAAWTKSNITAALDQAGADGTATSATSLTATAGNGTCLQAITLASSARFQSAYVKRLTGSGVINMTTDNGATWTTITVTAAYTKLTIPTQTLANPTVGFRIVTSGDAIAVDFVQNENGAFATSPIAATTVAVTRAADNIFAASPWLGGNFTMLVKASNIGSTAVFPTLVDLGNAGHTSFFLIYAHNTTVSGKELVSGVTSFDNVISASGVSGSATKSVMTLNGTAFRGVSNGAAAASLGTLAAISGLTQFDIGSQGGANSLNGYLPRVTFWNSGMTDAQMQAVTP